MLSYNKKIKIIDWNYFDVNRVSEKSLDTCYQRVSLAFFSWFFFVFCYLSFVLSKVKSFDVFIIIELLIILVSFIVLIVALFITKLMNTRSFGNPKYIVEVLDKDITDFEYQGKKMQDWADSLAHNRKVIKRMNDLTVIVFGMLLWLSVIMTLHIILFVNYA